MLGRESEQSGKNFKYNSLFLWYYEETHSERCLMTHRINKKYLTILLIILASIGKCGFALCSSESSTAMVTADSIFLEGKKLCDSDDLEKALTKWKPLLTDDLYGPVIHLVSASKHISRGQFSLAETSIREFMKRHPSTPYRDMALSMLIDSQVEQGKAEAARVIQTRMDKSADSEKPALIEKLARLDIKSGNYAAAAKRLQKLTIDYPASVEGLRAAESLSEMVSHRRIPAQQLTETDERTRAGNLFQAGKFDLAVVSYRRLLTKHPDDKNIRLKLARSLYKNRDNQEAVKMLQNFLNGKVSAEERTEAEYLLSLIYWRMDRDSQFESSCRSILEKGTPKFKKRVTANLAAFHFERGNFAKAEEFYNKLLSETTDTLVKADITWKLAWIRYRTERFKEAANLFSQTRKLSSNGKLVNPSKYWEARSLARTGLTEAAEKLYRELLPVRRNDYYAIEAAKALGVNESRLKAGSSESASLPDISLTSSQMNIREVKAALKLMDVDLPELALANLRALPKNIRDAPPVALLMAAAAHNCQFYGLAYDIILDRFGQMVDDPPESSPSDFMSLAYPKAHFPHTLRQAALHSVDPYLVWSIMRQESRYDSAAVSPAGAIGLMQVTPDTARKLPYFKSRSNSSLIGDLLEPRRNISTGIEILANNLRSFDGNIVLAIASYNADPRKVKDWVKRNGKLKQDEFIENIPFLETRLYVKKVLANLAYYKRIHARKDMAERW